MDNKLSELSRPVDICNWKMDSWRAAPCNGTEWAKGYFEGWNKYHQKVEGLAPLYSQEYVSALLADNEAKDKRIADLEAGLLNSHHRLMNTTQNCSEWERKAISYFDECANMSQRIEELEAKLDTPVRLPSKNDDEFWFDGVFQVAKFDRAVERSISAAGFKFVGVKQ